MTDPFPFRIPPTRSLRAGLLGPLVVATLAAAVLVAFVSGRLGERRAGEELRQRFDAIERTLNKSTFPLGPLVLRPLADLTRTRLITRDNNLEILNQTGEAVVEAEDYQIRSFATLNAPVRPDGVYRIDVLFDRRQFAATRRRATLLPLATGLSTVVALGSITLFLTTRLVGRIDRLRGRVETIAGGEFGTPLADPHRDELGQLAAAVDSMAAQLDQLWKQIHRRRGEELLHQIAGGMAHQLRNSLTGARMAIDLHGRDCPRGDDESLRVAVKQIEASEDTVRRLLTAAAGRPTADAPGSIDRCFEDVRQTLQPLADHLGVCIDWQFGSDLADRQVADGATWIAAVGNLVQNAIEAGRRVDVSVRSLDAETVRVVVGDDGEGISIEVGDQLFEPFVTGRPEGLGLGLAVVARAAERLGGDVRTRRENGRTVFEFDASILKES